MLLRPKVSVVYESLGSFWVRVCVCMCAHTRPVCSSMDYQCVVIYTIVNISVERELSSSSPRCLVQPVYSDSRREGCISCLSTRLKRYSLLFGATSSKFNL